jgi:hypothetical protein
VLNIFDIGDVERLNATRRDTLCLTLEIIGILSVNISGLTTDNESNSDLGIWNFISENDRHTEGKAIPVSLGLSGQIPSFNSENRSILIFVSYLILK